MSGVGTRALKKLLVFVGIIIFAGFSQFIDGLDVLAKNFSISNIKDFFLGTFVSAFNNLYASVWMRVNSIIPNLQARNVGSLFLDFFYIALAYLAVYVFVFIIVDFATGDKETPKIITALVSVAIMLALAFLMKDVTTTTAISNATIANNQTIANLSSVYFGGGA